MAGSNSGQLASSLGKQRSLHSQPLLLGLGKLVEMAQQGHLLHVRVGLLLAHSVLLGAVQGNPAKAVRH